MDGLLVVSDFSGFPSKSANFWAAYVIAKSSRRGIPLGINLTVRGIAEGRVLRYYTISNVEQALHQFVVWLHHHSRVRKSPIGRGNLSTTG